MVAAALALLTLGGPSTPEAAVRQYVDAWNRRDIPGVEALLIGADHAGRQGFPPDSTLSYSLTSVKVEGVTATVRIALVVHLLTTGENVDIQDRVDLRLGGNEWKLMPVSAADPSDYIHVLQWFGSSTFENTEQLAGDEIDSSPADTTLWNARHLASAMLRYRTANGGRFMAAGSDVHKLLATFLMNERFWESPRTGYPRFSVNSKLFGLAASDIRDPDHTVLVYEGAGGVLALARHRSGAVAFASGRVQLVNSEQEGSLKWTP